MFDGIARRYDFLNGFLSLGTDRRWRRKAVRQLEKTRPARIIDIATGTGDLALELLRLRPSRIVGVDISARMLEIGKQKIVKAGVQEVITLQEGDSEQLDFADMSFDAATVAFGVRNFENVNKGLSEMARVLKPGGQAVILEFAQPERFPVRQLYNFYFNRVLPFLGRVISGNPHAYSYLPRSVGEFPYGDGFLEIMRHAGFSDTKYISLSFGIAAIYTGIRN